MDPNKIKAALNKDKEEGKDSPFPKKPTTVKPPKEANSLEDHALKLYNANKTIRETTKVKDVSRKYLLDNLNVGDTVDLDNVGLTVDISEKVSVKVDEDKLKEELKELVKNKPEVEDVITEEWVLVTKINEDVLQNYIADGEIDDSIITKCTEESKSKVVKVKEKKGGK